MNDFERFIKMMDNDIVAAFIKTVEQNEEYITELINSQLDKGQDGLGKRIVPPYSKSYKSYKSSLGLPVDRVNLKLTGEYRKSTRYRYGLDTVDLFHEGNEDLAQKLIDKYGEEIEMLSQKNENIFVKKIFDDFIKNAFGNV